LHRPQIMDEEDKSLTILLYVIAVLFGCVAVVSLSLLLRTFFVARRKAIMRPRLIYFGIFLHASMRLSFHCVSLFRKELWAQLQEKSVATMMVLDMLPEVTVFAIYLFLLFVMLDIYISSKKSSMYKFPRWKLWWSYVLILTIVWVIIGVYSLQTKKWAVDEYQHKSVLFESALLNSLAGFLAIGFIVTAMLLYQVVVRSNIASVRKRYLITRLMVLIGFCAFFFLFHTVGNLIVAEIRIDSRYNSAKNLVFFSFYYIVTEILPISTILLLMAFLLRGKNTAPIQDSSRVPLMDPSRSGEELSP